MSIKARRKNLRMYNLDEGDIQGNPELLIRAGQQEAIAPSNPSIGNVQTAICLFPFKIRDSSPNVPPMQPIMRDAAHGATSARRVERAEKWRLACHAMIVDLDADAQGQVSGLEHSSHCIPDPFSVTGISKTDFIIQARRYPIYVGGYINPDTNQPDDSMAFPEPLRPGTAIVVRDNDVQGGMHGTIMSILETPNTDTQFRAGPIRELAFAGGTLVDANSSAALRGDPAHRSNSLDDLDPDLRSKWIQIVRIATDPSQAREYGMPSGAISLQVTSVWRSPTYQQALIDEGKTTASPLSSLHCVVDSDGNPKSKALDFVPLINNRPYSRDNNLEEKFVPVFLAIGKIIEFVDASLTWGGDFRSATSGDPERWRKDWKAASELYASRNVQEAEIIGWDPVHIDSGSMTDEDRANIQAHFETSSEQTPGAPNE